MPVQPVQAFPHASNKFNIVCPLETFISAVLLRPPASSLNPAALSAFINPPGNSALAELMPGNRKFSPVGKEKKKHNRKKVVKAHFKMSF